MFVGVQDTVTKCVQEQEFKKNVLKRVGSVVRMTQITVSTTEKNLIETVLGSVNYQNSRRRKRFAIVEVIL